MIGALGVWDLACGHGICWDGQVRNESEGRRYLVVHVIVGNMCVGDCTFYVMQHWCTVGIGVLVNLL